VAAVDEQQAERRAPQPGHRGGAADHDHHVVLDTGRGQRGPQPGQRVQAADGRVHQGRVVVLPARLVLFGAAVVVDGDDRLAGLAGRRGQVDRGLAAVAADLQHRPAGGVARGRGEQGEALGGGHEPGGRLGRAQQLGIHHESR
jgi:hypothetical protein